MEEIKNYININNEKIEYVVVKSKRAKRMRIEIKGSKIKATIPHRADPSKLHDFINMNTDWIKSKLKKTMLHLVTEDLYVLDKYENIKSDVYELINSRLLHFNKYYNLKWNKVRIKNQSTLWGSCSKNHNLNFNYRLYYLPKEICDYVIVHELCHLKEFNHSSKFWALVGEVIPNYKALRHELRKYELKNR